MQLLISTPLFLLAYETHDARVSVIEGGRGEYYGISWTPDGSELILTHSALDNSTLVDPASYAGSEVGYLSIGSRCSAGFLSAPHQALCIDDEWVLVTNTGRNALAKVRIEDFAAVNHRYTSAEWDRLQPGGREGNHLNSLFFDGHNVYLLAHNFDKGSFVMKLEWPSLALLSTRAMMSTGLHNIWVTDEGVEIACDSNRGGLIEIRSEKVLWENGNQGYTRGLAATDDYVFVGNSENTIRANRSRSETGFWVLDRAAWKVLDYINLGNLGGVHEIRIADEPDHCHHRRILRAEVSQSAAAQRREIAEGRLSKARLHDTPVGEWLVLAGALDTCAEGWLRGEADKYFLGLTREREWVDGSVRARLRFETPSTEGHLSLVARYVGPGDTNMYAALFSHVEQQIFASVWVNSGRWERLGLCEVTSLVRDHELSVEFQLLGGLLRIVATGELVCTVRDSSLLRAGRTGLRVVGNNIAVSQFEGSPVAS